MNIIHGFKTKMTQKEVPLVVEQKCHVEQCKGWMVAETVEVLT